MPGFSRPAAPERTSLTAVSVGSSFWKVDGGLGRAREAARVDEKILSGDVARLRRAQECAGRAEFVGRAEALRRNRFDVLRQRRVVAGAAFFRGCLHIGAEAVGVE